MRPVAQVAPGTADIGYSTRFPWGHALTTILDILRDPALDEVGIAAYCDFDAGASIVEEGSEGRNLYLIETGLVRVSGQVDLDGEKRIRPGLCDLRVDEIFGELGLFERNTRSASVVAVEPSRLRVFDGARLAAWFDDHPTQGYLVLKALFGILNGRLRTADRRLESLFAWGLKAHGIEQHL